MCILKNRKSVPKPYFSNKMEKKSVNKRNPNPTKIKQKAICCKRPFCGFRTSPFFDFFGNLWDELPDLYTRVGSALLMYRPSQRYLIGPSTWLLSRKQNNLMRMYCLFSRAFVQPFIPPELGAAGILEAPMFPSKIGSGGGHKANRFLARLFFPGLFERVLFFVLGDSQVNPKALNPEDPSPKALNPKAPNPKALSP